MAYEANQILIGVLQATSNLSGKAGTSPGLFSAVTFDASGGVSVAAAGKNCDGFLQNNPAQGQAASVATFGVTKAYVSATVTAGQLLQVDSTGNGSLVPVSSGTVVAKALQGSGTISSGVALIAVEILKSNAVYS